jgi:hypothetical protein
VNSIDFWYHNAVWQGADMKRVSLEAGHRPAGAPKHRGVRAPGGAKRPETKTVRSQLHLGEQTQKRLAVHAALVGRNASRVADEILLSYLVRFGQGRAIFDAEGQRSDHAGDVDMDRRDEGLRISPDDQVDAA